MTKFRAIFKIFLLTIVYLWNFCEKYEKTIVVNVVIFLSVGDARCGCCNDATI